MDYEEYTIRIYANGTKWYQDNKLHRINGPAIEYADGEKQWYQNGKRHRIDGPAIEYVNGYKAWYKNGKRHRDNGPAIIWVNDKKEYWLYNNKVTENLFLKINSPKQ